MRARVFTGPWLALLSLAAGAGVLGGDAGPELPPDRLAILITQLGDESFARREEASRQLIARGERVLPALRQAAATSGDLEVRRRAEAVGRKILLAARKCRTLGIDLVLIDPGEFEMGSPRNEPGRRPDEDQHKVRITRPFLLGACEVTQEEYEKVMKTNPSWFAPKGGGKDRLPEQDTDRYPVEQVSWFDAVEFCNRLSQQDGYEPFYKLAEVKRADGSIRSAEVTIIGGNGYRLPTEAEWEYACRAGTTTPYHYGGEGNGNKSNVKGMSYSTYGGVVTGPDLKRTARVGSYPTNGGGLFDMHGNVAEWCQDWYDKDYYAISPAQDPPGPAKGQQRAVRGGSWLLPEASSRSAARIGQTPDERKEFVGFRIARTP
jgi:sulfatase modifying factor 1